MRVLQRKTEEVDNDATDGAEEAKKLKSDEALNVVENGQDENQSTEQSTEEKPAEQELPVSKEFVFKCSLCALYASSFTFMCCRKFEAVSVSRCGSGVRSWHFI